MKKLLTLLLCAGLLLTGVSAFAETQRKKPDPASTLKITRNAQDPTVLTVLGKNYLLFKSEPDEFSEHTGWTNVYTLEGETNEEQFIAIIKIEDMTSADVLKDADVDDYTTLDARNANDVIASSDAEDSYVVYRLIQVEKDVFILALTVPLNEQTTLQDKKNIFRAVRNTPADVITEGFVQTTCRFGSDCRMD